MRLHKERRPRVFRPCVCRHAAETRFIRQPQRDARVPAGLVDEKNLFFAAAFRIRRFEPPARNRRRRVVFRQIARHDPIEAPPGTIAHFRREPRLRFPNIGFDLRRAGRVVINAGRIDGQRHRSGSIDAQTERTQESVFERHIRQVLGFRVRASLRRRRFMPPTHDDFRIRKLRLFFFEERFPMGNPTDTG